MLPPGIIRCKKCDEVHPAELKCRDQERVSYKSKHPVKANTDPEKLPNKSK